MRPAIYQALAHGVSGYLSRVSGLRSERHSRDLQHTPFSPNLERFFPMNRRNHGLMDYFASRHCWVYLKLQVKIGVAPWKQEQYDVMQCGSSIPTYDQVSLHSRILTPDGLVLSCTN